MKGLHFFRRHAKQYIRKHREARIRLHHHSINTEEVRGVVVGEDFWWRRAHSGRKLKIIADQVWGYLLVSTSN